MPVKEQIVHTLQCVRSPIANYQEHKKGVPAADQYSFVDLVTSLCQHAYATVLTIATMLFNVLPFVEGFLFIIRFILDKLISIIEAETIGEKVTSSIIFLGQLIILGFLIYFIMTLLLLPLIKFTYVIIARIFNFSTSKT